MDLFSATKEQLEEFFERNSEKPFRAKQIFEWIYQKKAGSFDEMTNLSKDCRNLLKNEFQFSSLKLKNTVPSKDEETFKYLWELEDGNLIESVLILSGNRRTVCVSSQVGCKGGCVFCSSGRGGFIRNLKTSEIVEQVINIARILHQKDERISNIVFMGMGEPLDNFDAVLSAIQIMNDEDGLNISQRKITISTVGLIDKISALLNSEKNKFSLKVNLTLSLHASNQKIRESLLPFAKKNDFSELIDIMRDYYERTKRDITFEYILIEGVNDKIAHARELAKAISCGFRERSHVNVNLIPYNITLGSTLRRPKKEAVDAFFKELEREGIKVSQRYAKGSDIAAACGQLAFLNKKEAKAQKKELTESGRETI